MEKFQLFAEQAADAVKEFIVTMTPKKAHNILFETIHFPIPYIIQALFVCAFVRSSRINIKRGLNIFVTFASLFAGRCLIAIIFNREMPILRVMAYIPIYVGIYCVMNYSSDDLVYKIFKTRFFKLLGHIAIGWIQIREAFHGVNIAVKNDSSNITKIILCGMILSCSEHVIFAFSNLKSRVYNLGSFLRILMITIIYYTSLYHKEIITQYTDKFFEYPEYDQLKLILLGYHLFMYLFNILIFGANSSRSLDISLLEK